MIELNATINIISENRRLIYNRQRTRLINNPEYTKYRVMLAYTFKASINFADVETLKKDIYIDIEVWTYKDLTNVEKGIVDTLQELQIIDNDRNVIDIHVHKNKLKRSHIEKIICKVWENK